MSKKQMIKLFRDLSYNHSSWEVFSDFLEMSAIAISNSSNLINYGSREKRYLEIVKKYTKEECAIFPRILGELVQALTEEVSDVLGEIFMELDLGNKWKGQFFTPYQLSKLMAKLSLENIDEIIEKNGFVELNEPTCGGGSLIIAVSEIMKKKGYNPQTQLRVVGQDLDIKAIYMSYIQLSLLGIPAVLYHGDTISMKVFSEWKTPFWIFNSNKHGKIEGKAS